MSITHFYMEQKSENFAPELSIGKKPQKMSSSLTKDLRKRKKRKQPTPPAYLEQSKEKRTAIFPSLQLLDKAAFTPVLKALVLAKSS